MKVTLVNFTPFALETLIFTKSTRLKMTGTSIQDICLWAEEKKMAELEYMLGTIKSSWEFVDYIFYIEGVTRAFTHQLVRHRAGTSFAQQAQRVVDMTDFDYVATGSVEESRLLTDIYDLTMNNINGGYQQLLAAGARPQDARGVLPTNISTNIIFKANLRTLHQMALERLCVKAQGEFQNVMRAIREEIIKVHPWAEKMLRVHCAFHGTCAFPNYQECPIKGGVYNPETGLRYDDDGFKYSTEIGPLTKSKIHELWQVTRAEAQPVAPKE
jgi:flavin-dependent thymidylate synthase